MTATRRDYIDSITVTRADRMQRIVEHRGLESLMMREECAAMLRAEEWLRPIRQAATVADRLAGLRALVGVA